jgi:hypothetical protein
MIEAKAVHFALQGQEIILQTDVVAIEVQLRLRKRRDLASAGTVKQILEVYLDRH